MVRFLSAAELRPDPDENADPNAALSEDRVFELRGAHVLFFDGDEGAWRSQFPYLAWVREPGGDRFGLVAGELARIVLPFVRLVPPDVTNPRLSAADVVFVSAQPGPEAWTRWLRAIMDAQISPRPESLSLWLREAATRLHSASPDIRDRLQLFEADLVGSQPISQENIDELSPADRTAFHAGILFTWGALADKGDGMLRHAADLIYYSGSLLCAKWRVLGSSWHSMLVAFYNVGIADGAIHTSNQLDHMQVSAWFMRILKITVLPPELQVHYFLGFERTLDLQDRLAGRPLDKYGGVHSAANMILQRFDHVIKHFPLTALLVATGPQHAPLHDQSLSDFIVEAARSLAPVGRQMVHTSLSLQLLRRLEGDISSNFATLLAEADFLKMHPNERLLDLESRASQSATATSAGAERPDAASADRSTTVDDGGFARVPKYWREQVKQALASPEYRAIQRDVLARLSAGGADAEADVIFLCATGESNERIETRMAAQALSATDAERAAARALTPRFCALSFFFAHGDFAADAVDPALRVVTEYAAEYWPGLIARRLAMALFPLEDTVPTPLMGASCPELLSILRGKDWHLADIGAALRYLRARMGGNLAACEGDFKSDAESSKFGDPRDLGRARTYYGAILCLFGYPDSEAEFGWGNALERAASLYESFRGVSDEVDQAMRRAIDTFLTAQFQCMGRRVHALRTTKNPVEVAPAADLNREAWAAFLQVTLDLKKAPQTIGLAQWASRWVVPPVPSSGSDAKPDPGTRVGNKLPKGASIRSLPNGKGFAVTKKDGSVHEFPYPVLNAELEKCGVPRNETRNICLQDTLGRAFFGSSACTFNGCTRTHGPLPKKGFNIHAAVKPSAKRDGDEEEKYSSHRGSSRKRKKQEEAAKVAAAAVALAEVPGAESCVNSAQEAESSAKDCEFQTMSVDIDSDFKASLATDCSAVANASFAGDTFEIEQVETEEHRVSDDSLPRAPSYNSTPLLPKVIPQSKPRLPKGGHFSTVALLLTVLPPPHVAMDLVLCEYSGSVASRVAATGTPVLAVDTRAPEYNPEEAGVLFYQGQLQDVALLRPWRRAFSFPPCEHQARSSAAVMKEKALDGRTWWGMCLMLFCYCLPAEVVLVENPRTYWTHFYGSQSQVVQPFFFGDDRQKTTYLFVRGTDERIPWTNNLRKGSTSWISVRLADEEQTNKFRSRLLPGMAAAIANHLPTKGNKPRPLNYKKEVEKMARVWFGHGLPLPLHYNAPLATSPDAEIRAYQQMRGCGDGRVIARAEAPETLIPPDAFGARPNGLLPFVPLKSAEVRDQLPKPFRDAAELNRQKTHDVFLSFESNNSDEARNVEPRAFTSDEARDVEPRAFTSASTSTDVVVEQTATKRATHTQQLLSTVVSLAGAAAPAQAVAVVPVRYGLGSKPLVLLPVQTVGFKSLCFGTGEPWPESQPGKQRKWQRATGWKIAAQLDVDARESLTFLASSPAFKDARQLAVVAALLAPTPAEPRTLSTHDETSGEAFTWLTIPEILDEDLRRVAAAAVLTVARMAIPMAPQHEDQTFKTGIGEPTQVGGVPWSGPPPLNVEHHLQLLRQTKDRFCEAARQRALVDPVAADSLLLWADRMSDSDEVHSLPCELKPTLFSPNYPDLAFIPFKHRCSIPSTDLPTLAPKLDPPPPDLPLPSSWQECVGEKIAREVETLWSEIEDWHQGKRSTRPKAKSWSCSSFAAPWREYLCDGHVIDFRHGAGRWLDQNGFAQKPTLNLEACKEYFCDPANKYPHQRAVAHILQGVSYKAKMEPTLTIAPNLHSMYKTSGGVEAVALEFDKHEKMGFRQIMGKRILPFLPFRSPPCGCAERKGEPGRPRVLNDEGFPHDDHHTCDSGVLVMSRNDAAAPVRPTEGDKDPKWFHEKKPRIRDAAHNAAIIAYLAHLLGGVALTFVFDFKVFFHQFVLAAHELWASGALVPERLPNGKVSDHLVCVVTLVMAMGVSPASNVAQEVANMLMWKLLQLTDIASSKYVANLCRQNSAFARVWRLRQQLAHDDYGTQARLVDALQYTDDANMISATPDIGMEMMTQFAHLIGPSHVWEGSMLQPVPAANLVANHLATLSCLHSVPRKHGLNLPAAKPEKWHAGGAAIWTGAVISPAILAVWVPAAKLFKTIIGVERLLSGSMCASEYRNFVSFVSSLADMREPEAYDMYGLWEPLEKNKELSRGPSTKVDTHSVEREPFRRRWEALAESIASTRGCSLLGAARLRVPKKNLLPAIVFEVHTDASGRDARSPGLGTFLYGKWQHYPLEADQQLQQLHVSHHELLALGLGLILADEVLPLSAAIDIVTDAFASYKNVSDRAVRRVSVAISEVIKTTTAFARRAAAGKLRVRHRWGELNVAADAASRLYVEVLNDLGAACNIDIERLNLSHAQQRFLEEAIVAALKALNTRKDRPRPRQRVKSCDPKVAGGTAFRFRLATFIFTICKFFTTIVKIRNHVQHLVDTPCSCDPASPGGTSFRFAGGKQRRDMMHLCSPGFSTKEPTSESGPKQIPVVPSNSYTTPFAKLWKTPALPNCDDSASDKGQVLDVKPQMRLGFATKAKATIAVPLAWASPRRISPAFPAQAAESAQRTLSRKRHIPALTSFEHASSSSSVQVSTFTRQTRTMTEDAKLSRCGPSNMQLQLKPQTQSTAVTLRSALLGDSRRQSEEETESIARALLDDTSDLALKPRNQHTFRMLLVASIRARAARFAPTTNKVDKSYWKKWCELCHDVFDTNPVRWDQQATIDPAHKHHPREVHLALSAFIFWCLHESKFKPSSMMARLRGVAREHRKRGLRFVDLRLVVDACKGILRILVAEHGPEVAEVKRKEPLQPWMLRRWLALPLGTVIGAYRVGASLAWKGIRVFITLMACSGFRKADVALDNDVKFGRAHLSLRFVFYRIDGVFYATPTRALLLMVLQGLVECIACVRPPPSKADPTGSRYGASPICSKYHPSEPVNFARELIEYELMRNLWSPEERDLAPLLLDRANKCWRKSVISHVFLQLLLQIIPANETHKYSVHSFRIFLACALRDAGRTNAEIREALRWATDDALVLYARANLLADAEARANATTANVESIRVPTVLSAASRAARELRNFAELRAIDTEASEQVASLPTSVPHDILSKALQNTTAATSRQQSVDAEAELPEVDSDLRAFSEISINLSNLAKQAARPIEARNDDESDEEEDI